MARRAPRVEDGALEPGADELGSCAQIFEVVRAIPRGRVATYGQVAQLAGLPGAARHVGRCLSLLPEGSGVPWHRVVNSRGAISARGWGDSAELQGRRLAREGVALDGRGLLSLARFRWCPEIELGSPS